jgi:hypothetical protein
MSSTGWTSFCRTGHIVDQCPPGEFLLSPRKRCPHCKEEVIGNMDGCVNIDKNNELAVYDVERLRIFADK